MKQTGLPLSSLLSQALVAFTIEFDNETVSNAAPDIDARRLTARSLAGVARDVVQLHV
jgi:hypothetical protein